MSGRGHHHLRREGRVGAHELRERRRRWARAAVRRRRLAGTGQGIEALVADERAPVEVRADAEPPRHCRRCGCRLNRYNPGSLCHPCQCPREATRPAFGGLHA